VLWTLSRHKEVATSAGARRSNHSARRKDELAQMQEDCYDRSSQTACDCTLLAHRARPLTDILARRVHVLYIVQIISRNKERRKKKVPTSKRTREDGERKGASTERNQI